ncbi:uncharacterized protein LOC132902613 [Amyelois transitella]|uniref:uncharacterized protein LOC132902613 n=1 Tax=Amyelois transitella TaxID=680683 RepID=UPI00298F8DA3|nr:uncharacterized protein LOC132902613 [Amyelois transitella]
MGSRRCLASPKSKSLPSTNTFQDTISVSKGYDTGNQPQTNAHTSVSKGYDTGNQPQTNAHTSVSKGYDTGNQPQTNAHTSVSKGYDTGNQPQTNAHISVSKGYDTGNQPQANAHISVSKGHNTGNQPQASAHNSVSKGHNTGNQPQASTHIPKSNSSSCNKRIYEINIDTTKSSLILISNVTYSSARGQSHGDFIQPITFSSGLYYDYLGTLKIKNNELKIIIPVDISHFQPHIQNIKIALENTRLLCKATQAEQIIAECNSWLQPLIVRFKDMNREYDSISHLIDNRAKRSAWIGGIGTVFKYIFGTLDENDGIQYEEAIATLQNDEKRLTKLMKENILVTTSVLEQYNKTIATIKENEIKLYEAIDKLSLFIKNISDATNELQILTDINRIFDSLETSILTLSFQLEDITNSILFSSQDILHPAIITPIQLHQELANNYRHLPSDLELPVTLDINSIHLILSISKLVCYYVSNKIVFVLQVPLVNIKEYVLFHNIALPVPYDPREPNSFSLISPANKYIAMTKDKAYYCILDDLKPCKLVNPGSYICDIGSIYSTDVKPICESELLTKINSVKPLQCETKVIIGTLDIWKPLINNKWIFVQTEPIRITIDCLNAQLYETTILGTGILTLPKNCVGYCKSTTLTPKYNIFNITSPINNFPDFNLINDSCCNYIKLNRLAFDTPPVHLSNVDLDDFGQRGNNMVKSLLSDLEALENQQSPHIIKYGTHYSIVTIILAIMFIVFLSFIIIKNFCKSGSNRPVKFNLNLKKVKSQTIPETVELTDRHDPGPETINPVAPLRTRI